MYPSLTSPTAIYTLAHATQNAVRRIVDASTFRPYSSSQSMDSFILQSAALLSALPPELVTNLTSFRAHGNQEGVILIRGLPVDSMGLGPTPSDWSVIPQHKASFDSEFYLLGCTCLLGEAFSFSTQHDGNLIQNIVPMRNYSMSQTGLGSQLFLEWHIEDAFTSLRADYVALICLRSDSSVATTFSSIRNLSLTETYKQILFEPRFTVRIDDAHNLQRTPNTPRSTAILFGDPSDPLIRLDPLFMSAREGDTSAYSALQYIIEAIPSVAREVVMEVGDILIIDNNRVLHGRTPYTPRFDGTDRWLQRAIIVSDIRKSARWRRAGSRVIDLAPDLLALA